VSGKVAFLYATFPRPTETFVRRELAGLAKLGFHPVAHSIWKGKRQWNGKKINRFRLSKLWTLFFWIPYWAFRKPHAFVELLGVLWSRSCPNLQNWNETFLGLGFALVRASSFKKEGFSLIHGVWATMPATAALAISKLTDIPFSMGAHAYDVFRHGGDWLLPLKFKEASFVRTSSVSSAQRIKAMKVPPERIKLIRRGLSHWPRRESFECVHPNRIEVLSVGRLVEKKGYFHQLELAAQLVKENVSFRLKIIGSGPLSQLLEKERDRMGLKEKVVFCGSKNEEQTKEAFLQCDAFLFTGIIAENGDRDGIPNVIPEALAAGCLVLASDNAGASEAFVDGISGFSINPEKHEEWVSLLLDFSRNPQDFSGMRKAGIKRAKEAFDVMRTVRSLRGEIETVIQES
jgi:colanic acid/amylovoran biosynthesis glycosyltransferase